MVSQAEPAGRLFESVIREGLAPAIVALWLRVMGDRTPIVDRLTSNAIASKPTPGPTDFAPAGLRPAQADRISQRG